MANLEEEGVEKEKKRRGKSMKKTKKLLTNRAMNGIILI